MSKRDFESIRSWMKIANSIQEKIVKYQDMADDEKQSKEIRELAKKEVVYQEKNLQDFLELVRSRNEPFSRVLILKYFEGYTLEEAALSLNLNYKTLATKHADFISYTKQNKSPSIQNNSMKFKGFIEKLNELLNPKYVTCCTSCSASIELSQDFIKKIYFSESRKARAIDRSKGLIK